MTEVVVGQNRGTPFPPAVKDRFKELTLAGNRAGAILIIMKSEFDRVPSYYTLLEWRRNLVNANIIPPRKKDDWMVSLQDQEEAIEDPLMVAWDYLTPELVKRLEKGEHLGKENMTFKDLFESVLKLGKAMLSHNESKQRRVLAQEYGISPYQQLMISIQAVAEKREDGSSDSPDIIDITPEKALPE